MKAVIRQGRKMAAWAAASVPGRVILKFGADNGPSQAVVIAWNALFSLFPMVLAMAALLGLALHFIGYRSNEVYALTARLVPIESVGAALGALEAIQSRTGIFAVLGLAGLVWSGSGLFGAMEQAFDPIFKVKPRDFFHQKLMAVGMMLLFTVLAGIAIVSSAVLPFLNQLPFVPSGISEGAGKFVIQPLVGVLSGVLLFGSMYYVVPNRRQRIGEVWPGALLAGVAFYALSLLFPLYLSFNKGLNQYGASFAFLFIVMNFFYFVGLITMLGVELIAVLHPAGSSDDTAAEPLPHGPPPKKAGRRSSRSRTILFGVAGAAIGVVAAARHRGRSA